MTTFGRRRRFACLFVASLLATTTSLAGAARAEPPSWPKALRKAETAVAKFRGTMPRTERYSEESYGYAVLYSVGRFGFGIGGAYGRGLVFERGELIGRTRYFQFTSGIQAGARCYRMIVFFKDAEALEYFKRERVEFVGQAGVAFATLGASADPAYNKGVAVFTQTRFGLMVEATVSGARLAYKPRFPE